MKTVTFLTSLALAFFAPVVYILLAIIIVVIWRRGFSFVRVKQSRASKKNKCKLYEKIWWTTIKWISIYHLTVMSFYFLDIHLFSFFGSEDFKFTKGLAVVIILYELFMLNENVKAQTGKGVIERFQGVVSKARELKDLKNDLLK